jgi:3'-phosphoadenosine 5'-phosphosulfate sulfotransferase
MSMLLLLSVGCSNLVAPPWQPGGSRYASGYAGEETDTATDTSDDTAAEGDGNAPVLLSGSAEYSENEAGSRTCTEDSNSDVTESAIVANGILTFIVGPIEDADAHIVIIHVNDYTRNQSNEIQVEVTGE